MPTRNAVAPQPGIVPELLTTKQAAALLGIGQRTLWRHSRTGLAPRPIKLGVGPRASARYSRAVLMSWIARGCPRCDAEATQ